MRELALVICGFVISLCWSIPIRSQTEGQKQRSETIKIQSTEVFVDAVVVDRKNRLVTGLTANDFEVYEDGVLQDVASFRVIRSGAEKPEETPGAERPVEPANVPPTAGGGKPGPTAETLPNVTIVLLDYSTTQIQHAKLIQDGAIKYVEKRLQPNDLMAVFVLGAGLGVVSDFTNDKAKLIAALKGADVTGSAMASDRAATNAIIERANDPENNTEGGAITGPGSAGQGSALAAASVAQHFAAMHISMASSMDRLQGLGVLSAIRAIAMGVKGIQGRKTLLLFSEGFIAGPAVQEELHSVTGLANRSQLAIYCIESQGLQTREMNGSLVPRDELTNLGARSNTSDNALGGANNNKNARGGETGFDRALQVGQDKSEVALRGLSDSTGGSLIRNTNDLNAGLERIDREMRSYYLMSYHTKDEQLDGRFHKIVVTVKRPDLTVRARDGYFAMPAGYESLSPAEFQLLRQVGKTDPSAKIPVFLRVGGFQQGPTRYRIPVVVEIPSAAIRFDANKGKHSARLQVLGLVRDSAGNFVTRFGDPVQMDLSDSEYVALKAATVRFVNQVQLRAGGDYSIEVLVKDLLSGAVTNSQQALHVGQPEPGLGLSTILLARELYKTADVSDHFLMVQGVRIMPSAVCQFRNGDDMIFYVDIYGPRTDPGKKSDLSIELVFMRDGQPVHVGLPHFQLKDSPGDAFPHITFCRFLHLAGLQPGNYSLVINVNDRLANKTAQGEAAFAVVH